jgi:hypothetical protein
VFGRRLGFVPLADLTIGPDELRVAVSKEQVKDAPNIEREGDERFSADESVLRPHYELNYSPRANRQRTSPDEAQHSWEREEQNEFAAALSTDAGDFVGSHRTNAQDCDERGPPRWHARRVIEERARGGPRSCCTLDWI